MAKQRGVVQLSGRVDNLCYYQQKKVRGGLVRRINLAMSERVKVGAEYQRLRTASSFFGGCSICASTILNMTGTRAKFLHFPDRQAILSGSIFKLQKSLYGSSNTDVIIFDPPFAQFLSAAYDQIVKNKMSKFLPSVPHYIEGVEPGEVVNIVIPSYELTNFCNFYNCIGIVFLLVTNCFIYSMYRYADTNKFGGPESGFTVRRDPFSWQLGGGDLTISFGRSDIDDACTFAILSALPMVDNVGGRFVTKNTGASSILIGTL